MPPVVSCYSLSLSLPGNAFSAQPTAFYVCVFFSWRGNIPYSNGPNVSSFLLSHFRSAILRHSNSPNLLNSIIVPLAVSSKRSALLIVQTFSIATTPHEISVASHLVCGHRTVRARFSHLVMCRKLAGFTFELRHDRGPILSRATRSSVEVAVEAESSFSSSKAIPANANFSRKVGESEKE